MHLVLATLALALVLAVAGLIVAGVRHKPAKESVFELLIFGGFIIFLMMGFGMGVATPMPTSVIRAGLRDGGNFVETRKTLFSPSGLLVPIAAIGIGALVHLYL